MKNYNDTIRNQTRDLPACSMVPQPTVPLRASASIGATQNTKCCSRVIGVHGWCVGLGDHILFMLGVWCWVITLIMILVPSNQCPKFFVVFLFMSMQL